MSRMNYNIYNPKYSIDKAKQFITDFRTNPNDLIFYIGNDEEEEYDECFKELILKYEKNITNKVLKSYKILGYAIVIYDGTTPTDFIHEKAGWYQSNYDLIITIPRDKFCNAINTLSFTKAVLYMVKVLGPTLYAVGL